MFLTFCFFLIISVLLQLFNSLFNKRKKYHFNLLLIKTENGNHIWNKENWKKNIENTLNNIFKNSNHFEKIGIKVLEYEKYPNTHFFRPIKLGKLVWNEKLNEKWTFDNPEMYFQNLEISIPNLSYCEKENITPDIFVYINNERDFLNQKNIQFDTFIVIAIATDLKFDWKYYILLLSKKLNSLKTITTTRAWETGKKDPKKNWTFHNSIQDTFTNGIYKNQNIHNFNFEEIEFEPYWEIIHESKF